MEGAVGRRHFGIVSGTGTGAVVLENLLEPGNISRAELRSRNARRGALDDHPGQGDIAQLRCCDRRDIGGAGRRNA